MARVTVEDCVERIPNRFELVMLAAQRARNVGAGAALTIDRDNDKNPVVALREIAAESVSLRDLEVNLVQSLQKIVEVDEPGEEEIDLVALQRELSGELESLVVADVGDEDAEADDDGGEDGGDGDGEPEAADLSLGSEDGELDFEPDGGAGRRGGPA